MSLRAATHRVRPVVSLQEFFKDSVAAAMQKQGVAADDHTAYYVVNLLTLFARARRALRAQQRPGRACSRSRCCWPKRPKHRIATRATRCCAVSATRPCSSRASWATAFARKLVDVDYYIDMGGAAYGRLSASVRGTLQGRALSAVFAELAEKFRDFVDVLDGDPRVGLRRGARRVAPVRGVAARPAAGARRNCYASTASSRMPR